MPVWVALLMGFVEHAFFQHSYWIRWQNLGFDPEVSPVAECKELLIISLDKRKIMITAIISIALKKIEMFQTSITCTFYCDSEFKHNQTQPMPCKLH